MSGLFVGPLRGMEEEDWWAEKGQVARDGQRKEGEREGWAGLGWEKKWHRWGILGLMA